MGLNYSVVWATMFQKCLVSDAGFPKEWSLSRNLPPRTRLPVRGDFIDDVWGATGSDRASRTLMDSSFQKYGDVCERWGLKLHEKNTIREERGPVEIQGL